MSLLPTLNWDAPAVRRLNQDDGPRLLRFLQQQPSLYAFGLGWLNERNVVPLDPNDRFQFIGAFRGQELVGVSLVVGAGTVSLNTDDPAAAHALGSWVRRTGGAVAHLIGPLEPVRRFWRAFSPGAANRAHVREQVLFELRSRDLRYFPEPMLQVATPDDLDDVYHLSLMMLAEEHGRALSSDEASGYRHNLLARIHAGRVYVLHDPFTGDCIFKASIAASSPQVAQIEGVFVVPAHRGQGVARRALSEMIRQSLFWSERVTLYTDADNQSALRLYRRLGFRQLGDYATLVAELH